MTLSPNLHVSWKQCINRYSHCEVDPLRPKVPFKTLMWKGNKLCGVLLFTSPSVQGIIIFFFNLHFLMERHRIELHPWNWGTMFTYKTTKVPFLWLVISVVDMRESMDSDGRATYDISQFSKILRANSFVLDRTIHSAY